MDHWQTAAESIISDAVSRANQLLAEVEEAVSDLFSVPPRPVALPTIALPQRSFIWRTWRPDDAAFGGIGLHLLSVLPERTRRRLVLAPIKEDVQVLCIGNSNAMRNEIMDRFDTVCRQLSTVFQQRLAEALRVTKESLHRAHTMQHAGQQAIAERDERLSELFSRLTSLRIDPDT